MHHRLPASVRCCQILRGWPGFSHIHQLTNLLGVSCSSCCPHPQDGLLQKGVWLPVRLWMLPEVVRIASLAASKGISTPPLHTHTHIQKSLAWSSQIPGYPSLESRTRYSPLGEGSTGRVRGSLSHCPHCCVLQCPLCTGSLFAHLSQQLAS